VKREICGHSQDNILGQNENLVHNACAALQMSLEVKPLIIDRSEHLLLSLVLVACKVRVKNLGKKFLLRMKRIQKKVLCSASKVSFLID
jgi:hypothetical protein